MPTDLKHLMDDALSGLRLSPSLVADAKRRYARRQRRRRVTAGVVTAAAVAVAALLWSAGGTSHSGDARLIPIASPAPSQPTRYAASGILLTDPKHGEPLNLCGAVATSLPPQCGLVPVRGVDIDSLPSVRTLNGVTWTDKPFRLVGTYSGGVLTVTESPKLAPASTPFVGEPDSIDLPCAAPPGGWNGHGFDPAAAAVLSAYGAANPDTFGGLWTAHQQLVAVVSTTGDPATVRQEIRRTYTGNLCVTKADYTDKFLRAEVATLNTQAVGDALGITMTSVNTYESRIDIGVVIKNKTVTDYLAAHFPAGLVRVTAFLVPVS
jgi:hypothetical protein